MAWRQVLFSLDGRSPRRAFWLGILSLAAVEIALLTPFGLFRWDAQTDPAPLAFRILQFVVTLIVAYPLYATMLKRMHDRDYPGTVALAAVVLDIVADFANMVSPLETDDGFTPLGWVLMMPLLILAIALLIELGLRRGTRGPNRFGPDPLAVSA